MRRIEPPPIQIPHTFRQPKPTQDTTDRRTMRRNQLRFSISRDIENESPFMPVPKR
jgi:hypothetical protein